MRRYLLMLCAILGAVVSTISKANEPSPENLSVQVTVVPLEQQLEVFYQLSQPVMELALLKPYFPLRGQSWQLVSASDLIITKGTIRSISGTTFDHFTIQIQPDRHAEPTGDISLSPVGDSGLIFSFSELMPADEKIQTRLCVMDEPHVCDFEAPGTPYLQIKVSGMIDELVLRQNTLGYVGPAQFSSYEDIQWLVDDRLPAWLVERQKNYVQQLTDFFAEDIFFQLQDPVVAVMSWTPDADEPGWSLGAYRYSTSVLRFFGVLPSEDEPEAWGEIDKLLSQQITVFFLDEQIHDNIHDNMRWFYFQIIPILSDEARRAILKKGYKRSSWRRETTKRCREQFSNALVEAPIDCGAMLHLLADELVRKKTRNDESFIDLFRSAIEIRRSEGGRLSDAYLEAIGHYDEFGHIADLMAAIKVHDEAFPKILSRAESYLRTMPRDGRE